MSESVSPSPPPSQPKSWFRRNMMWFIPTVIVVIVGLGTAFVASILFFVFSLLRSSEPYKVAVSSTRHDQRVIQALGTPIREGWFVSGNINYSGSSGEADLAIPISGPSGSGTIYAIASRSGGEWRFSILAFQFKDSGERIAIPHDRAQLSDLSVEQGDATDR